MEKILKVKNVEKYYGAKTNLTKAINDISFEVEKGEFVAIMGASGSGKTTLLNCISTIDKVTAGEIYVDGENITKLKGNKLNQFRRDKLGFIFQDFNLLDTLTGYENISLSLAIQNVPYHEQKERIEDIASKLNISKILNKYPYQISGGEKQRIASARAIITNPSLVLADEPTGNLDMETSQNITELLRKICVQGSTVIMVTHNMQIVEKYPGRVFRCKDHRLEEITEKNKVMNDAEKELANEPDSNDQNHTHREDNIHFNYDV